MQGVSWIDCSRIKSSDSWNRIENHIFISPSWTTDRTNQAIRPSIRTKEDENEPPPKGRESGAAKLISHPMGTLTTVLIKYWELPSDVRPV
jgi:hypothetical protein